MAASCSYWIWSSIYKTLVIAKSDRLERLTLSLPQDEPAPSLILIVGCRQRLPTYCGSQPRLGYVCFDLCEEREIPFLLGTVTLRKQPAIQISYCCPARKAYLIAYILLAQANTILYFQLLYLFANIICFYAYNLKNLEIIFQQIIAQFQEGLFLLYYSYPPQVLIVLARFCQKQCNMDTAIETFNSLVDKTAALA